MRFRIISSSFVGAVIGMTMIAGCASPQSASSNHESRVTLSVQPDAIQLVNRITWGANSASLHEVIALGADRYLDKQLHPGPATLPASVQAQIDAMTISQRPMEVIVKDLEVARESVDAAIDQESKKAARQSYQQELNRLSREAATRSLLRATYSPNQLQEQMTWFWLNHFNVYDKKANIRALIGDYEDRAIRPNALGKFRDLLRATAHHPAMLRYLDNQNNAANRINENYAREIMELHTLGVDGGYQQRDVQELARILTGVGANIKGDAPKVKRGLESQYVRQGLFEFNPNRHDYGDKQFLGQVVRGRGLAELDEAIDRLSRHPATARFISRKMAIYLLADEPPSALVDRMAQTFLKSDGDISATLQTLFSSTEFTQSLGHKFKDPIHYVVSAVRIAYDDSPILNAGPMLNWLNRMGEPLYGHQTPDGYQMVESAWASPGQMTTRFEIAKAIGAGSAGLFKTDGPKPQERAAFPQLSNAMYFQSFQKTLSPATRQALDQATSQQEWNTFLLSSPEMMKR